MELEIPGMMLLTKHRCMICGRITDPKVKDEDYYAEQILDDICDECKDAVLFVREIMSQQGVLVRDHRGSYQLLKYEKTRRPPIEQKQEIQNSV